MTGMSSRTILHMSKEAENLNHSSVYYIIVSNSTVWCLYSHKCIQSARTTDCSWTALP